MYLFPAFIFAISGGLLVGEMMRESFGGDYVARSIVVAALIIASALLFIADSIKNK